MSPVSLLVEEPYTFEQSIAKHSMVAIVKLVSWTNNLASLIVADMIS